MSEEEYTLCYHLKHFPHNDLHNGAFHFLNKVREMERLEKREGISFEIVAGYLMLAMAVEAYINFLGAKLIKSWNERARFRDKMKTVNDACGVQFDETIRPFDSILKLKQLRDQFAHAKPSERQGQIAIGSPNADQPILAEPFWEMVTEKEFYMIYEDVDIYTERLMRGSRLNIWDGVSAGKTTISKA